MENQTLFLFIGQAGPTFQTESAVEGGTVVRKETTGEGITYLNSAETTLDCVVTDHDPPDQDCFELLEAVPPSLPVIVAPAGGTSELATQALSAGATTYIDTTTVDNAPASLGAAVTRVTTGGSSAAAQSHQQNTADERIEEFANIVSHELRSPLQTATASVDLAKAECESEYLDDLEQTIEDISQLVDSLLDRLRESETSIELTAVDLASVVADSWPDQTTATLSVESDLPTVSAERSRLRQLLTNLFQNSIVHSSENVAVRIGVIEPLNDSSDSIGIYVADDGPGIDPAVRESIFEYGYTGSVNGTGFGLAIVDEIVEAFDWEITVTESSTGGARFEIHQIKTI